jgi:hypothetical protein
LLLGLTLILWFLELTWVVFNLRKIQVYLQLTAILRLF